MRHRALVIQIMARVKAQEGANEAMTKNYKKELKERKRLFNLVQVGGHPNPCKCGPTLTRASAGQP